MRTPRGMLIALAIAVIGTGCAAQKISAVPGADAVKVTSNNADVANCNPLGNVTYYATDPNAKQLALNATVGLGGNTLQLLDNPGQYGGVAYKCPVK
ncbi:MAG TPA: hypothetical protein VEH54_05185 [Steroidobacteraceae bacterium]|nr:hypothetical protein [Steroidobacteraceae bacterium]